MKSAVRTALLVLIILSNLANKASSQEPESTTRIVTGLGYDLIEQGYYLSEIDTLLIDEDSLATLKRESEEISSFRLKSLVDWTREQSRNRKYRISNLAQASDEDIRNNLQLGLTTGSLRLENEFEFRAIWERNDTGRVGYITNRSTARFEPEISPDWKLKLREGYEFIRFDGEGAYTYDYNYNRFQIGAERKFGWINSVEIYYRNDLKDVADSTRLGYLRHRGVVELAWSPAYTLDINLENQVIRTESRKEQNIDDGWEDYLDMDITLRPNLSYAFKLSETLEYTVYDTQEVVSFNSVYSLSELKFSKYFSPTLEVFVEPSFKIFWSELVEFQEQDYRQHAIELGFDYSAGTWFWLTIYHQIGQRDYTHSTGDFYTDYLLNRLTVLGNVEITKRLRLDLLVSVDWENHDSAADDNDLTLISAGLDYRFR